MRRTLITVVGLIALAAGSSGLIARYLPIPNHLLLFAAAFSPYLMCGAPLASLALLLCRRWIMGTVALGIAVTTIAVQLPLYIDDTNVHQRVRIRIMTANLYEGHADPAAIVGIAKANADVVAIEEVTPRAARKLAAAGLDDAFPFRVLDARPNASGTGLWSRLPFEEPRTFTQYTHAMVSARIHVDGVAVDPTVFAAHPPGPWPEPVDTWDRELSDLQGELQAVSAAAGTGCVIVAGDFNATVDMLAFRRLLRSGYDDAAEQTGAGRTPTYPANEWFPPLIAIDHVLTRRCNATAVHTIALPGSDHRGLIAEIHIPDS